MKESTILKEPKRYYVKYKVNWQLMSDSFSCTMKGNPIYEINTELDDRYYWEDWEIVAMHPIKAPMKYCFC